MKEYVWKSIFSEEIESFLRLRESQGHTLRSDRGVMKMLDEYLTRINIAEKAISPETAENWVCSMSDKMCVNTIIVYISHYRQFAGYLSTLGYSAFIPEAPLPDKSYIPYIFSDEEMMRLINAADMHVMTAPKNGFRGAVQFAAVLRILWGCGLRLNEALLLKSRDVDLDEGIIIVRKSKGNKDRLVPMHITLTYAIRSYMKTYPMLPEDYIFHGKGGRPRSQAWARNNFCRCLTDAGIEKPVLPPYARNICLHCIRHSFAASSFRQLNQNGHEMYDEVPILSTYMGHERIYGTERYLHMTADNGADILRCMEKVNDEIFPEVT